MVRLPCTPWCWIAWNPAHQLWNSIRGSSMLMMSRERLPSGATAALPYRGRWSLLSFGETGIPFFGGTADDRPLGINGSILSRPRKRAEVAVFATIEQAHEAAKRIPNRRAGSLLGVVPTWR